jgi:ankyrin repeat protein
MKKIKIADDQQAKRVGSVASFFTTGFASAVAFMLIFCLTGTADAAFMGGSANAKRFALDRESWAAYTLKEVQALIKAGADVNAKDKDGVTPLMLAAQNSRDPQIVRALIRAGADVNAKDEIQVDEGDRDDCGMTPLMLAAGANTAEVVNILIRAGADVRDTNNEGNTPLWFSLFNYDNVDVVSLLIQSGGADLEDDYLFLFAASDCDAEVVKLLIQAGYNVNAKSDNGSTPLIAAAGYNSAEVVALLIKAGADINAKDGEGNTPLSMARERNDAEVLDVLIKAAANPAGKNGKRGGGFLR